MTTLKLDDELYRKPVESRKCVAVFALPMGNVHAPSRKLGIRASDDERLDVQR